ncbi:hypothetical protein HPB52_023881 [Rhipicephalus sanguineus]|uniref:Phosphatidylinositol-4,5-bisphosphate 4-phosphatase n=1 Tax=Rhipicephalus sanguineus TaxID=34632 RepID=A0A9D4YR23_RHISA|nr:hypothetical protein HPB52_023881 [Rhipicephalus sanguineus]
MDLRDDSAERTPLLQEQSDSSFPSYNVQARDELPPPYSPQYATQGNIVPCRVCGYVIDITNRRDQHVVKCSRCNEATLGTYQYAVEKKGIYVVYACGLIAFLLFLLRSLYYLTMRVSHIEEPA